MRNVLLLLYILLTAVIPVSAQGIHLSEAQRNEQRKFIKSDTLPVSIEALPNNINSHFSEYAGRLFPDSTFLFTSMRADVEEDFDNIFETSWYCNIYRSLLLPDGRFSKPENFSEILNGRNTFNSNYCLYDHGRKIIYSRCKRIGHGELQCDLWSSELSDKKWTKPRKLPTSINAAETSNMHPCLVEDSAYDVLYFVSNRPNGVGGLDIWYSIVKNGVFNTPTNAGYVINTEGNEITPFYDSNTHILYFSSDEHIGIGDYDIFYSEGALGQWGEVSNMGIPYNSEYNDYYFCINPDNVTGYFSSNRPHDEYSLDDTCCNDLFHFQKQYTSSGNNVSSCTPNIHDSIALTLPITLYFQNDQPNPHSLSDTTSLTYEELYRQYLREEELYIQESQRGLTGSTLSDVQQSMADFMRDSVATGYDRLLALTQYLHKALDQGDSVTITIRGYASPLHNSDYNRHLSARRIVSLLNFLRTTEQGYFQPYIDLEKPGLRIICQPLGAVLHDFQTDDKRETVYGIQAAKDRKIIIQ